MPTAFSRLDRSFEVAAFHGVGQVLHGLVQERSEPFLRLSPDLGSPALQLHHL
jgi:hypothetical protein